MRLQYFERVRYGESDVDEGIMVFLTQHQVKDLEAAESAVFSQHREVQAEADAVWLLRSETDTNQCRPLAIWAKAKGKESLPERVPLPSPETYRQELDQIMQK